MPTVNVEVSLNSPIYLPVVYAMMKIAFVLIVI